MYIFNLTQQDKDIVVEAFVQIIDNAESMKKESEDTRTR